MPLYVTIDGVRIYIYSNDHPPPHIHLVYAGFKAAMEIEDGYIIAGSFPPAKVRAVRRFLKENQEDLLALFEQMNPKRH